MVIEAKVEVISFELKWWGHQVKTKQNLPFSRSSILQLKR